MKRILSIISGVLLFMVLTSESGCNNDPVSTSGAVKASAKIQTDLNGYTAEQNNIIGRQNEDNKPGSIKHLYIISAYSGQVLLYSTVKQKVTSSGKRLSPSSIDPQSQSFKIDFGNGDYHFTNEVLGDDGTYGNSVEYIYWWDSKNVYHQQYITGGMIVHISNQPIAVKNVTLNLELNNAQ